MSTLRRGLLLLLLASCEAGPTSEWPNDPDPTDDSDELNADDDDGPPGGMDAGSNAGDLDARTPSQEMDAGLGCQDAGDAGCPRGF